MAEITQNSDMQKDLVEEGNSLVSQAAGSEEK